MDPDFLKWLIANNYHMYEDINLAPDLKGYTQNNNGVWINNNNVNDTYYRQRINGSNGSSINWILPSGVSASPELGDYLLHRKGQWEKTFDEQQPSAVPQVGNSPDTVNTPEQGPKGFVGPVLPNKIMLGGKAYYDRDGTLYNWDTGEEFKLPEKSGFMKGFNNILDTTSKIAGLGMGMYNIFTGIQDRQRALDNQERAYGLAEKQNLLNVDLYNRQLKAGSNMASNMGSIRNRTTATMPTHKPLKY